MLRSIQSKTSEKLNRQKQVKPATNRIENEYSPEAMQQYFQITINILEGKKLSWSNPQSMNSYATVAIGKKKYRTSIRRNMEDPLYKEFFVFDIYTSMDEMRSTRIWLAIIEPRSFAPPHLIGEANIELGAIWSQPNHQVYHKWAQLSLPKETAEGPVGFLKLDLSIMTKGDIQEIPAGAGDEKPEENILLPPGSEQQRANYIITIHSAFSLPNSTQASPDQRYGKPPSTFIRVSYCGLVAKTAVQHRNNNPNFNEQISIVEMFPNMNQMIRLEVCCAEGPYNKVLACSHLNLSHISFDGENGFLPTFGPSLVHMYGVSPLGTSIMGGDEGPFHKGALLMSVKTKVPYYKQGLGNTNVEPVSPVQMDKLWVTEDFCIFCPILEVSMLDVRVAGKLCGVAITIGEIPCQQHFDEDFSTMANALRYRKLHYSGPMEVLKSQKLVHGYLEFPQSFPTLQLTTQLPDFRFRMYRNNMVLGIATELELVLVEVERRLKNYEYTTLNELRVKLGKAVDDAATGIVKFLEIVQYTNPQNESGDSEMSQYSTELDEKQLKLQRDEMEKIHKHIIRTITENEASTSVSCSHNKTTDYMNSRKSLKILTANIKLIAVNIKKLIFKSSEGWPDIILWLLNSGSRVAFSKVPASDVIYSTTPEQRGRNCGRIQTIYFKPLKCSKHMNTLATGCFCVAGKIELLMWMGLYKQMSVFEEFVPPGYKLLEQEYDMSIKATPMDLECRIFICRAKLSISSDSTDDGVFIRVNALGCVKETTVVNKSTKSAWNQVLKIKRTMNISTERLALSPPLVLVEVYEQDLSKKTDFIGRFQLPPILENRKDFSYAPKLQWYEIYKGREYTGQVLMSVQLMQVLDNSPRSTTHKSDQEGNFHQDQNRDDNESDSFEFLPEILIPKTSTYKVDIYWWGLREVNITRKPCVALNIDDFVVKSEVVTDKKSNCNFPNGRVTQLFKAPLDECSPPLCVSLYDSSTFGRTLFLGANIVHYPNKFIIKWITKSEREDSIKSASIMSSSFVQVSRVSCIKKYNQYVVDSESSNLTIKTSLGVKAKSSMFRKLFYKKEPEEEECALLPVVNKHKEVIVKKRMKPREELDWWSRFTYSHNESEGGDKMDGIHKIIIYPSELEHQPEFSKFKDWCSTLKIYGKKSDILDKDDQLSCGYLKAGIAIYRWPPPSNSIAVSLNGADLTKGFFYDYPCNEVTNHLIRVYIIKAMNLTPKDYIGKLNPYIVLDCGKKRLGDRNSSLSRTCNPIFGKMFEFRCTLPDDYLLAVSVFDRGLISTDQLIGSTTIDLEDRIYSKHRASVGLSREYNIMGPTKWRDLHKPSDILREICERNHFPIPVFPDASTVVVNGVEYKDNNPGKVYSTTTERRENICLDLLHDWHTLPLCGYHLVPEHVETRTLFHPNNPGFEQGKIQLWVDIFPFASDMYIPPPADVKPRKLETYELRLVIWSVKDVRLSYNNSSDKKTCDIYVKAWIGASSVAQNTDVHYNTLAGEGKFNWRMIFNFEYQPIEKKMIVHEKGPFTEVEEYLPPILVVQVMDSDALVPDDVLASLTLTLNAMQRGSRTSQYPREQTDNRKIVDLFTARTLRGWWPLRHIDQNTGNNLHAGLIDMELTLLPKQNAVEMPVGIARDSPHSLPEPKRLPGSVFVKPLHKVKRYLSTHSYKVLIASLVSFLVVALVFACGIYYFDFLDKISW